jgi:hypothetical protein
LLALPIDWLDLSEHNYIDERSCKSDGGGDCECPEELASFVHDNSGNQGCDNPSKICDAIL